VDEPHTDTGDERHLAGAADGSAAPVGDDTVGVPGGPLHLGTTSEAVAESHVDGTAPATTARPSVGGSRRRVAMVLGLGGACAMALELTAGDWAAFRLGDDLGTSGQVAAAGFVAFTVGMTTGRLGGDSVQVRLGVERLLVVASVLAGVGLAVAELAPGSGLVLVGFLVAGLGVSVLFPQLYDAAARAPGPTGSGFTSMLLGQRTAALLTPLTVGALAATEALDVGTAMAVVSLPAATLSLGLAIDRLRRSRG
jgi:fucose permease